MYYTMHTPINNNIKQLRVEVVYIYDILYKLYRHNITRWPLILWYIFKLYARFVYIFSPTIT